MSPTQSFRLALRALGTNQLRTSLTMLGMIIGVGAVIALMSLGNGVRASVTMQVNSLGTNLLFITATPQPPGGPATGAAPAVTAEDAAAILESRRVPQAVAVAPEAFSQMAVVANGRNTTTRVSGVTPDFSSVRNFRVAQGSFITREHMEARSAVAVLGATTKETLFGQGNAIGQTVRVNQTGLRVIGLMEVKGAQSFINQDDVIFVPLTTLQARVSRRPPVRAGQVVSSINVQLVDDRVETIETAANRIGALLRERHRVRQDDFAIRSQRDLMAVGNQITGFITLFLGTVAGISLLIGGVGIMNVMLISVTERTREIGIRKAVGAKRRHILTQFLLEAVVVSCAGGLIGTVVGIGGSRLLDGIKFGPNAQPIRTVVTADTILIAIAVAGFVGLFFGVWPALRASRLSPIEALRSE